MTDVPVERRFRHTVSADHLNALLGHRALLLESLAFAGKRPSVDYLRDGLQAILDGQATLASALQTNIEHRDTPGYHTAEEIDALMGALRRRLGQSEGSFLDPGHTLTLLEALAHGRLKVQNPATVTPEDINWEQPHLVRISDLPLSRDTRDLLRYSGILTLEEMQYFTRRGLRTFTGRYSDRIDMSDLRLDNIQGRLGRTPQELWAFNNARVPLALLARSPEWNPDRFSVDETPLWHKLAEIYPTLADLSGQPISVVQEHCSADPVMRQATTAYISKTLEQFDLEPLHGS